MKNRKRKKAKTPTLVLFIFFGTFVLLWSLSYMNDTPFLSFDRFAGVKKYRALIYDDLAKYGLQNYTNVVIALMQQESHGKGGDPMQASESVGLPPNSIKDPSQSISLGVKHFKQILAYGKRKKVDFATIIQSYNMGMGYIDYVAQHGGKNSEELAKNYSLLQVHKYPAFYKCGGDKLNFRYPYCFGDFSYSAKVVKNIQTLSESIPASGEQQKITN